MVTASYTNLITLTFISLVYLYCIAPMCLIGMVLLSFVQVNKLLIYQLVSILLPFISFAVCNIVELCFAFKRLIQGVNQIQSTLSVSFILLILPVLRGWKRPRLIIFHIELCLLIKRINVLCPIIIVLPLPPHYLVIFTNKVVLLLLNFSHNLRSCKPKIIQA